MRSWWAAALCDERVGRQARQSQLGRAHRGRRREVRDQAFFDDLRSSDDIEMSLVVCCSPLSALFSRL